MRFDNEKNPVKSFFFSFRLKTSEILSKSFIPCQNHVDVRRKKMRNTNDREKKGERMVGNSFLREKFRSGEED